jgi:phosphate transport system substrate-binding protein
MRTQFFSAALPVFSLAAFSEPQLPRYAPHGTVAGTIRILGHGAAGKDFIEALVKSWEAGFHQYQPNVQFDNKLYGTASAIGALYAGVGDLAILGREIWPSEISAFREVLKYPPLEVDAVTGSFDVRNKDFALAIYVHKDNPLTNLTLAQVDAIFGCQHLRGSKNIRKWDELGLKGEWTGKPIGVYGIGINRGFAYFFEQTVFIGSSKWNPEMQEFGDEKLPDGKLIDAGKQVLDALAKDRYGIAYSAVRYANPQVKAVALAAQNRGPYVPVTRQTVMDRSYPLTRVIPIFLNRTPGHPVDPKVKEFLRYILSRQGQAVAAEDGGYLPLTAEVVSEQLKKLE